MTKSLNAQQGIPVYTVHSVPYRHPPLALGLMVAFSKNFKDGSLNHQFDFIPDVITSENIARDLVDRRGPGVFLFSDYLWNSRQNLELSRLIKNRHPESITIHGGPDVPKYQEACQRFFDANPFVDIAVRGEGEVTTAELLEAIVENRDEIGSDLSFLSNIRGITFRRNPGGLVSEVLRTPDRDRIHDLDQLPSPYVSGWFRSEDVNKWVAAIIETNRGCPYGCTFCDWGSATLSKIRQFSIDRVYAELEWIAQHRVKILWIADANFGIFPRDVLIARMIADLRRKHGSPRQVLLNYAKNTTERLAEIVEILHSAGVKTDGIIAIQTQDRQTLENIDRSNIRTERYEELIETFRKQNLPVSSDLMIGLPGATVESFKADLQFFVDREVVAKAYPTMLLANSPMAQPEYIQKYRITTDADGFVVSTYSYSRADRWVMQLIYDVYKVFVAFSVLKYFSYYLQADHGIPALTFIDDVRKQLRKAPRSLPWIWSMIQPISKDPSHLEWTRAIGQWPAEGWMNFHAEIVNFVRNQYGIAPDTAMETVLLAQAMLMPRAGRTFPESVQVKHDIVAYFQEIRSVGGFARMDRNSHKKLSTYPSGTFEVTDPGDFCHGILNEKFTYDSHNPDWELSSPLLFSESIRHFVEFDADD